MDIHQGHTHTHTRHCMYGGSRVLRFLRGDKVIAHEGRMQEGLAANKLLLINDVKIKFVA